MGLEKTVIDLKVVMNVDKFPKQIKFSIVIESLFSSFNSYHETVLQPSRPPTSDSKFCFHFSCETCPKTFINTPAGALNLHQQLIIAPIYKFENTKFFQKQALIWTSFSSTKRVVYEFCFRKQTLYDFLFWFFSIPCRCTCLDSIIFLFPLRRLIS
jgi:hypothetical protein